MPDVVEEEAEDEEETEDEEEETEDEEETSICSGGMPTFSRRMKIAGFATSIIEEREEKRKEGTAVLPQGAKTIVFARSRYFRRFLTRKNQKRNGRTTEEGTCHPGRKGLTNT